MQVYRAIIYFILFTPSLVWSQTPTPAPTPRYFESHYNPVPNTGGANQLKMLGTWGYFTSVDGYFNNYLPAEGDETGAFWNNGSDDILVGVTTITQGMADDRAYGLLDIFGNDPDSSGELSEGLTNGATIFFRIYGPTTGGEQGADPTLSFDNGAMWTEQTMAADVPSTPIPTPTVSPTPSAIPTASPTPSAIPTASPIPSASPKPTIPPSPTPPPTPVPTISPSPTPSLTASPTPTRTPIPTSTPSPTVTTAPTASPSPTPVATPSSSPSPSATPTPRHTVTPTPPSTPTPRPTVFPDPETTTQWDLLYGDITGSWNSETGDEVVAYDSGGTIRLHYVVTIPGHYGSNSFYGPPTGSGGKETSTFTWRFYSAAEDRICDLRSDLSEWPVYQGDMESYRVDLSELLATPTISPTPSITPTPTSVPSATPTPSKTAPPTPTPTVIPIPTATPPVPVLIYSFPLDTDPGWTTESDWAFGVPTGQGGSDWSYPDPTAAHTGKNVYGYNLSGNYPDNMAESYWLTTSSIDCSGLVETRLKFWRWLNVERSKYDDASIMISVDGSYWYPVWQNPNYEWTLDYVWAQHEYDISSIADGSETVYICWGMGITNEWNIASGWNIDDIEIWGIPAGPTPAPSAPPLPTPHSPLPIIDFNGDGTSDIAIFRETSGLWALRGITRAYFGGYDDQPVPGDYNGDGTSDIAIFRGASGLWAIRGISRAYFGGGGDIPASGDYNGDGSSDIGIFRESSGLWAVRGITRAYFGTTGDIPVSGYYSGDETRNIGIFRGSSGLWAIRGVTRIYFGSYIDETVPGDYDGNGQWSVGIFRPASGLWAVRGVTRAYFGSGSDLPVSADYIGNNTDSIVIFREASGLWAIRGVTRVYFGGEDDIPVTR